MTKCEWKNCKETNNIEKHHIDYEKNITINLCLKHHKMIHKKIHKNHELAPKNNRTKLMIELNENNTKLLRRFTNIHNTKPNYAVNEIIKYNLQEGNYELTSDFGKPYCRVICWDDFKKIGRSFFRKNRELMTEFLGEI